MEKYELESNEVILYEDIVTYSNTKGKVTLTLTSQKIIFEKEKGLIKKEKELIEIIRLEDIKIYNGKVQVQQKNCEVNIQASKQNINILFDNIFKASNFVNKIVETITGTTVAERNINKVNNAINAVDNVLGINTRETFKGVIENGIPKTFIKGLKGKEKNK